MISKTTEDRTLFFFYRDLHLGIALICTHHCLSRFHIFGEIMENVLFYPMSIITMDLENHQWDSCPDFLSRISRAGYFAPEVSDFHIYHSYRAVAISKSRVSPKSDIFG